MTKGMISINGVIKEEPRTGLLLTKEHVEKLSETITRVQRLTIAEVSDITKIHKTINWQPKYDDLSFIVKTAFDWEKKLIHEKIS